MAHAGRNRALFAVLVLSLALFSCTKKEALRHIETEPHQGPLTVEALKQSVGFGDVRSLKALAEVSITKQGEDKGSLNGTFAYRAPGKIRIDLFGPFGLTMTKIVVSENLLQFFVPSKNTLYEWDSPEFSFTGLTNSRFRYEMGPDSDGYVLIAYMSDGPEPSVAARYFFDGTYLLNRTICFYKDGSEAIKAEFNDFNGRVPERTRLTFSNGLVLDIALQEPQLDADIPAEYFRVIEHADKRIEPFEEIFRDFTPAR